MSGESPATSFGLLVIGNEILDGRVKDRHFETLRDILRERHFELRYALFLPDRGDAIETHLTWAFSRPEPFFSCGGIGATPDDLTRDCAARVLGVPVALHPEGVRIMRERFGECVSPSQLRLVAFPEGAALIPNPFNRIPGFRIRNGYFLPGFPEMAEPMMRWVLDSAFPARADRASGSVLLPGAREGMLLDMMEEFVRLHPDVGFSSLPRFVPGGTEVTLGLSGTRAAVDLAMDDLCARLERDRISYQHDPAGGQVPPA